MPDYDLCFSPSITNDTGAFKLLELPPELADLATQNPAALMWVIPAMPILLLMIFVTD
jgi:hypothetical protein